LAGLGIAAVATLENLLRRLLNSLNHLIQRFLYLVLN
jgi:hypothetical protein